MEMVRQQLKRLKLLLKEEQPQQHQILQVGPELMKECMQQMMIILQHQE